MEHGYGNVHLLEKLGVLQCASIRNWATNCLDYPGVHITGYIMRIHYMSMSSSKLVAYRLVLSKVNKIAT